MTPEDARELLDGTTPGPWEVETVPEMRYYDGETWETPGKIVVYADEATLFAAADEFVGDEGDEHDNEKNVALAAAAPDMAAMIAGMREEYQAEYQAAGGRWFPVPHYCSCGRGWGTKQQAERAAADWKDDGYATRIIRRYVTKQEVAE